MHGAQVVARAVLEGAGAVDHGVEPGQRAGPVGDPRHMAEVALDPVGEGEAPFSRRHLAPKTHHLVALGVQPRQDIRADQPVAADDQNAHAPVADL